MKKTRKLLALVLAMLMAFSCMAMPAMASDISPRYLACPDTQCGGRVFEEFDERSGPSMYQYCNKCKEIHLQPSKHVYSRLVCSLCRKTTEWTFVRTDFYCTRS